MIPLWTASWCMLSCFFVWILKLFILLLKLVYVIKMFNTLLKMQSDIHIHIASLFCLFYCERCRDRRMVRRWCVICRMRYFDTFSFSWLTIKTSSMPDSPGLARLLCLKRTISGGDFACFTSPAVSGTRCCVPLRTSTVSAGNSSTRVYWGPTYTRSFLHP